MQKMPDVYFTNVLKHVLLNEYIKNLNESKRDYQAKLARLEKSALDYVTTSIFSITLGWILFVNLLAIASILLLGNFRFKDIHPGIIVLFSLGVIILYVILLIGPMVALEKYVILLLNNKPEIKEEVLELGRPGNKIRTRKDVINKILMREYLNSFFGKLIKPVVILFRLILVESFALILGGICAFLVIRNKEKIKRKQDELNKKIADITTHVEIVEEMMRAIEEETFNVEEHAKIVLERVNDKPIYSLPSSLIQAARAIVFPRIKDLDDFTRDAIERIMLAAISGNYIFEVLKYNESLLESTTIDIILDSQNTTKNFLLTKFLPLLDQAANELRNETRLKKDVLDSVLQTEITLVNSKLKRVRNNVSDLEKLIQVIRENPNVIKEQTKFSRDLAKLKQMLEQGPLSETVIKSRISRKKSFKGNKGDYVRFLSILDDDIVMINTPRGTYYTLSKHLSSMNAEGSYDAILENDAKDLEELKNELKMLTDSELELKEKILTNVILKMKNIKGNVSKKILDERLARLNAEKNLIGKILKERRSFTKKLMLEHPTCPYCGADLKSNQDTCPTCHEKLKRCMICNLIINETDGQLGKCPYCNSLAHLDEFKAWVEEHEKCPVCKGKLSVPLIS